MPRDTRCALPSHLDGEGALVHVDNQLDARTHGGTEDVREDYKLKY